jgi:hypothetical protein
MRVVHSFTSSTFAEHKQEVATTIVDVHVQYDGREWRLGARVLK